MLVRILLLVSCFCSVNILAQDANLNKKGPVPAASKKQTPDRLIEHLNAAESYQRAGDLASAAVENRAVLDLALQRFGNIAIEEGRYADAVGALTESLKFGDIATKRTTLAIAYLRQGLFEKALAEAQTAVSREPEHVGARYILSNIFYTKEDYEKALPELEWVFAKAPDFEIGRALGLTYLNLRQIEKARAHFKKLQQMTGKQRAGQHILFARFYERTNYPADAERELKSALRLEPDRPKVNFYLGYLLMQHGGSERLDEARAAFAKELKLVPNDFYALFFSGVAATAQNQNEKAIPYLKKAIEVNPNSGEAHLFLGQAQMELGDLVNAEKNLRRAVELEANGGKNTQARRTHFMLGRLLLKTGRKEEAKKELAIAAKLQRSSLNTSRNEVNRILGQVVEGDELEAEQQGKTAVNEPVKLKPERAAQLEKLRVFLTEIIAQSYNNLGVIETQSNRLSEAVENFSAAYRWKPDFPNLARNLGIISFRTGQFEKAIPPLNRHLEKNPEDLLIRKMLGSSLYLTEDFAGAVKILEPIKDDIYSDAELTYFYGISLIRLKRDREAAPVFDRLAGISQQNSETLFYAAQGFMILGDYERAVREFERVVSLAPNMPKAHYFIGQSLIRLNRPAEAEKAFARELEIDPNDAPTKYHLALTLIERKIETERAVRLLQEAIGLRYDYADARYQLGKIYLEKGEPEKAIAELEKAAAADADKDYIHYQLSIAYRRADRKEEADRELEIYQKLKKQKRDSQNPAPMGEN